MTSVWLGSTFLELGARAARDRSLDRRLEGIEAEVLRKDPNRRRSHAGSRSPSSGGRRARATGSDGDPSTRRTPESFILYVEGARDREILSTWARRLEPGLSRMIEGSTVILGGRQPARAVADFRKRGGSEAGMRGLIVLDRDHHDPQDAAESGLGAEQSDVVTGISEAVTDVPGLPNLSDIVLESDSGVSGEIDEAGIEVFVWRLRHIESYLLVPSAIKRVLGHDEGDDRVDRALADPRLTNASGPDLGGNGVHAKRILGAGGSLSEALGAPLLAGQIARAMRADDFHADVRALFVRIGDLSGAVDKGPEVVIRSPRA